MVKNIVYVDFGIKDKTIAKVSLYDPKTNFISVLTLAKVENSNVGEILAVLNAMLYIAKYGYKYAHILCDNKQVSENTILTNILKSNQVSISWIPREINNIANNAIKTDNYTNYEKNNINLLYLFYNSCFK